MYSDALREAIAKIRLQATVDPCDRNKVLANLVFVHQVITASESLLEEAVKHSEGDLKQYFIAHLEEERGHQEWLADDLMTAGIDVKKMPLSHFAVAMAGSQYYLIRHVSPVALLGYMAVLEGCPMPLEAVEDLEAMHGKEMFRTLRYHAAHDIDHGRELFALIDKYDDALIMHSAVATANYLNEFFRELGQE
jgi:hypothetical protein